MAEEKHSNPFENHINSESFDISRLDSSLITSDFEQDVQRFFDSLPHPLNHALWDNALDERQQAICAHITLEVVDRVMRVHYGDKIRDLRDDELIYLLTVPVTIAMLAQQQLYQQQASPAQEPSPTITPEPPLQHPAATHTDVTDWGIALNQWLLRARDFLIQIIRRRH